MMRYDGHDGHDWRTPAGLVADGDCRWPDGRIYLPPHWTGRERRVYLRMLLTLEPETDADAQARRNAWERAGGGCVCDQCGEQFYDHPKDQVEPSLTLLCSRERVKL
jgi:hypothetical protein